MNSFKGYFQVTCSPLNFVNLQVVNTFCCANCSNTSSCEILIVNG